MYASVVICCNVTNVGSSARLMVRDQDEFAKGVRVRLNDHGMSRHPRYVGRSGVIVGHCVNPNSFQVHWEGRLTRTAMHRSYLALAESIAATDPKSIVVSREVILDAATSLFCKHGFDGVSLAELRRQVGLTHGGFYFHFESKTALAAEVCSRTLKRSAAKWNSAAPDDRQVYIDIVDFYLSEDHRASSGRGGLATALGADVARQPTRVRKAFTEGFKELAAAVANRSEGSSDDAKAEIALAVLSQLSGAVVLARAVNDQELGSRILSAVRASLASNEGGVQKRSPAHGRRAAVQPGRNRQSKELI